MIDLLKGSGCFEGFVPIAIMSDIQMSRIKDAKVALEAASEPIPSVCQVLTTYKEPSRKISDTPTFLLVGRRSFQTIGIGIKTINPSVMKSVIESAYM
jgi:hypothetical protein